VGKGIGRMKDTAVAMKQSKSQNDCYFNFFLYISAGCGANSHLPSREH
jgi:hypothetical protein